MDRQTGYLRTRLSAMMFLQFFVWATWWVPVTTYAMKGLFFEGWQAGWLGATVALGAMVSPLFVGPVADRLFATERILCVLHLIGGACLFLAALQHQFGWLMACLMVHTLAFMPTLALANSLTFRNIDNPDTFPRIAVFGTIGWIVSGWLVGFVLGETRPWLFCMGGLAEVALGVYCLSLPHTPPKRAEEVSTDVFGFKAIQLLKQPSFFVFVVCAFLIAIPVSFYFFSMNVMLTETARPAPTALMTLAQLSEICVMAAMPWFISAIGLRTVIVLGMLAWTLRFLLFATLSFPLILLGLLLHGFGYCFVYVGSYIYVDKKAPQDLRASAQSLIAFLMLGVGMFLGTKISGWTVDSYPPYLGRMAAIQEIGEGEERVVTKRDDAPLPSWQAIAKALNLDKGDAVSRGKLRASLPEGLRVEDPSYAKKHVMTYSLAELEKVFLKIDDRKEVRTRGDFRSATNPDVVISVTRSDWIAAQVHRWTPMWLWFALAAGVICLGFAVGSLLTADDEVEAPAAPQPPPEPAPQPAAPPEPQTPPQGEAPAPPQAEGAPPPPAEAGPPASG